MEEKKDYNFKIVNNEKIKKHYFLFKIIFLIPVFIILFYFMYLMYFENEFTFSKMIFMHLLLAIFIYIPSYIFFLIIHEYKIQVKEMYFDNLKVLYIKYKLLNQLKSIKINMNNAYFIIFPSLDIMVAELMILDKNHNILFKLRASNGITWDDLENIAISFRISNIQESKRDKIKIENFKHQNLILKTNYLSIDKLKNIWYI